jgi:cytochrome bd ubiquinol oxidase subunit II
MLETIWFLLWGILWAVYFMLDGFDLGVGVLVPFLGKNDTDKQLILHSVGPFWNGNEVWLITAGGVTFAAFPAAYATLFSAFYTPLMLILFALIMRAVSFEFRGMREGASWRSFWDGCAVIGSFLPSLLLGVAFANIFKGIPIDDKGIYHGTLITLLNPYGLAGGMLFLFLFLVHGALWVTNKSEGALKERAVRMSRILWVPLALLALIFLVCTALYTRLYDNYVKYPPLLMVPFLAVFALFAIRFCIARKYWWTAWWSSAATILSCTLFGVIGLYPNLLPSSLNESYNVTAFNASSSPLTLTIMLVVALIFLPVVILYQAWVYMAFKGKVGKEDLEEETIY